MLDTILNVVLWLLSFLGITLLIIIGIILLALILVLFVPVHYRGEFIKNAEMMRAQIKVNWLLHIVRVYVNYEKELLIKAFVLFFKVYDSGRLPKEKKTKKDKNDKKESAVITEDVQDADDAVNSTDIEEQKDRTSDNENADTIKENQNKVYADNSGEGEEKARQNIFAKIKDLFQNIICKCKSIYDKIKDIVQNINYYIELIKEEETRVIFGRVLGRLLKVLKSIRPRKLKADVLVGTGSPDTTGYLMAVAGMLYPYLGKHVNIAPDFDNTIFEGKIDFKGRITLFIIIMHALKLYMDKELSNLISRFKREDA